MQFDAHVCKGLGKGDGLRRARVRQIIEAGIESQRRADVWGELGTDRHTQGKVDWRFGNLISKG